MFNTRHTSALSIYPSEVCGSNRRRTCKARADNSFSRSRRTVHVFSRCILSFPSFHCFSVQQSVCLYVRSGNFHSSRIRCARFFIIVRFCVFQLPLQDGLPILNAYDIRQVVRSYGSGSGWLRHGSGWLRCLARFILG